MDMKAMLHTARAAAVFAALVCAAPAFADGPASQTPDVAAPPVQRAAPTPAPSAAPAPTTTPAPVAAPASAEGQSGVIALPAGDLSLNVPATYRFYPAAEAQAFLQRTGAAAPSGEVLGLLAPAGADLQAADTWATVISYEPLGCVAPQTSSGLAATTLKPMSRRARHAEPRLRRFRRAACIR